MKTPSPDLAQPTFRFGLETEYLIAEKDSFRPLWHRELSFSTLNGALESIPLDGIPSLEGLELEPPHTKLMPYVVEGYHLPDQDFRAIDILPKGLEIRTPVCSSIEECLDVLQLLHDRMQSALDKLGLVAVSLSHHPVEERFRGPQNKRRHDFWMWAMEVMTTYGPDINIGLDDAMAARLDRDDLLAKINYYSPAMAAFSVGSPFRAGKPWEVNGRVGKSLRTYRRSIVAPPIEFHPHERNRLEFKVFEMSPRAKDFHNYFLLVLALLLDDKLEGRGGDAQRVYESGDVARFGLGAEGIADKAREVLLAARRTLPQFGFDPAPLSDFETRLERGVSPADEMLTWFRESGTLGGVLSRLSRLEPAARV